MGETGHVLPFRFLAPGKGTQPFDLGLSK